MLFPKNWKNSSASRKQPRCTYPSENIKTEPPRRHGNQMWFLPEECQALKTSKPSFPAGMGIKFGSYPKRARLSEPPCRHGNQIWFLPQERPRSENINTELPCRHGNQIWFVPEESQVLKTTKARLHAGMGTKFGSYPKMARL